MVKVVQNHIVVVRKLKIKWKGWEEEEKPEG
jgi:hypothetical protein